MNKKIEIFNHEQLGQVRTMYNENNDEIWFVGKDVAKILGYKNISDALIRHIDEEDKDEIGIHDSIGRKQKTSIINESGMYALIFGSQLEKAKEFKRWVTSEVLRDIRKQGAYLTDAKIEEILDDPDTIIKLATQLKEERQMKEILALENKKQQMLIGELKPKADYVNEILKSKDLLTITQIAKDYGMSAVAMNKLLHELKVQYKESGQWLLYAKYHDKGYTKSETFEFEDKGIVRTKLSTKWTQKGRLFLYELLKDHNYYPIMEKQLEIA